MPYLLPPVPKREWAYSQALFKDQLGNDGIRTRFRVRARAHDGHTVWCGWFLDRDDADAFLFALAMGTLRIERELWRLPQPEWHPGIGGDVTYDFATQTILTTTGSNQTYNSPADWNNSNNTVECLGGGGGGAQGSSHVCGSGAGAYSKISNFSFATPGTTTATYRVGSGGQGRTAGSTGAGNNGSATWWNSTTDPGNGTDNSKCSADYGRGGAQGSGSQNGGAGGATTASWGETKYAGGRGGNLTGASGSGASGGGGAAGPSGAGGNGGDNSTTGFSLTTAGGSANNGTTAGANAGTNDGNAGTEFAASYGCGSGGGGGSPGGAGGNYGGGAGGFRGNTIDSRAGSQGLIVITYTPAGSLIFNPFPLQHMLVR